MELYRLFLYVEIQSEYKVVYYDYEKEKRVVLDEEGISHYTDKEIKWMYVEDGILFIEIDIEEE